MSTIKPPKFTKFCVGAVSDDSSYRKIADEQFTAIEVDEKLSISLTPQYGRGLVVKHPQPANTTLTAFRPIVSVSEDDAREILTGRVVNNSIESVIYAKFKWFDDICANMVAILVVRLIVACEQNKKFKNSVLSLNHHKTQIFESFAHYATVKVICLTIFNAIVGNLTENVEKSFKDRLMVYINTLVCICLINFGNKLNNNEEFEGFFIDPSFALINHSCCPNTKVVVNPNSSKSIELISTCAIKGQLFTNYCFLSLPRPLRQYDLHNRFYFKCKCTLCTRKFDYFFSYNCDHCGSLLCSPSLSSFLFSTNLQTMNFASGIPFKCKCCHCSIDPAKFSRNLMLHKLMILIYIYFNENQIENFECFQIELFVQSVLQGIGKHILFRDVFYQSLISRNSYCEEFQSFYKIISKAIDATITDRIIPLYCFPFNFLLPLLEDSLWYRLNETENVWLQFSILLKVVTVRLRSTFLFQIPADFGYQYTVANVSYKELAFQFSSLASKVIEIQNKSTGLKYDKVIEIFLWASLFFCLEALKTHNDNPTQEVSELKHLLKKIRSFSVKFYEHDQFKRYFIPILKLAKVFHNFTYKNKTLKVWTAARTQMELFKETSIT